MTGYGPRYAEIQIDIIVSDVISLLPSVSEEWLRHAKMVDPPTRECGLTGPTLTHGSLGLSWPSKVKSSGGLSTELNSGQNQYE